MPSDANGVYSLPDGYLAVTGAPIQASQHNPPLEDIASALTGRLPRSGVAPMTGPLRVPDGTVDAPTLAFASDPTAGFYFSGGKIYPSKPFVQKELIGLGPLPWSRTTAPAGWVLCYGQTLNRVTYADLWAVAQIEIAAGNPMYNNGDGALTFGIVDTRGYVTATADAMGGVAANRLTSAFLGAAPTIGLAGGAQSRSLSTANMASYTPTGTVLSSSVFTDGAASFGPTWGTAAGAGGSTFAVIANAGSPAGVLAVTGAVSTASTFFGNNNGGSSAAFGVTQPTLVTHSILYAGA